MDEFLSGLANYTEKENPYHKVDAYLGTEFYNTETILKLFYPLVVFHLNQDFRILCNQKVVGIDELRYYLNYVILPRVSQYWKQTPTRSDMAKGYESLKIVKKRYQKYDVDVCEEDIQQMNEYIAKYYPDTVAEEEYQKLDATRFDRSDYISMKINEYNRYEKIKETLDKLVLVTHGLSDFLENIKVYLQTIRYASEYDV